MVNSITGGAVDAYSAYSAVSSAVGAKKPEDTKTAASKASQNAAATFERTTTDEEIAAKEAGQDVSKESEKKIYKPDTELYWARSFHRKRSRRRRKMYPKTAITA